MSLLCSSDLVKAATIGWQTHEDTDDGISQESWACTKHISIRIFLSEIVG